MVAWSEVPAILEELRDNPRSESAWERFYLAFFPRIVLLLNSLGEQEEESVKDLVQQTFYQFLRANPWRKDQWRGLPEAQVVLEYLRVTAKNLWRDQLRSRRVKTIPLEEAREVASGREPFAELEWKENARLLEALTPEERHLLKLRYVECLTLEELAESLGISAHAVSTRLYRVQLKLRQRKSALDR